MPQTFWLSQQLPLILGLLGRYVVVALVSCLCWSLARALYNVFLHPLAEFPGPLLWRSTRLAYFRSIHSGWLHRDILKLHQQYGAVVRIAPDELSFARPDVWQDIFAHKSGKRSFAKFKVWFSPRPDRSMSLLTALDPLDHARVRKALTPGFTEAAIARQEQIITSYVDTLVEKLQICCRNESKSATVDIVKWIDFAAFDIIGDLGFGDTFNCLQDERYHPWMAIIMNSFRYATISASVRFFPGFEWFFKLFVPKSVNTGYIEHYKNVVEKLDKRLNLEQERPDLISLIEKDSDGNNKGLPRGEVEANAQIFVTAGSNTTATVITGIFNNLIKTPLALKQLTSEVRSNFSNNDDIKLSKLKALTYLDAVLNEGFRLCNPTPIGVPHVVPAGGATVCGSFLPAGTVVNAFPLGIGLLPRNFHDASSFCPERWLPDAVENPTSPYYNDARAGVNVFGVGPRSCIAKNLATAEVRLVVAKLLWAFDMAEVDSASGKLRWEDQRSFFVTEKKPFEVSIAIATR